LALGIGLNVATFSVVHAVLLRPLPYADAHRVVNIFTRTNARPFYSVAAQDIQDFREQTALFEDFGASFYDRRSITLTGGDEPILITRESISYNLFEVLGINPLLGRRFLLEDMPGAIRRAEGDTLPPPMLGVILSHGLWQRYLGGDRGVIGQTVQINKQPVRIVAVMPPGFTVFPPSEVGEQPQTDIWLPSLFRRPEGSRRINNLRVWARLKSGVSLEQAQAEMDAMTARLQEKVPEYADQNLRFRVESAQQYVVKGVRPALVVLLGAVGFLLLLVCANVTNLLLVRARMRSTEMSIRGALGGSAGRLARQSLTESLMLACAGGLAGVALAWGGIRLLLSLQPANIPRFETVSMSGPILAFSLGLSLIAAVLFSVLPAVQGCRINLSDGLKCQTRSALGGKKTRLLGSLVVVEVALSMVLLLGAGALLRTFFELQSIRPGFEPNGALVIPFNIYDPKWRAGRDVFTGFVLEVEERIRALPGVDAAGSTAAVPFTYDVGSQHYAWDEESEARYDDMAHIRMVTGDYFRAMQIRMLAGRTFSSTELREPTPSVIVDETIARKAWPDEDPIGKRLVLSNDRDEMTVVGVVEHVPVYKLREETRSTIYVPHQWYPTSRLNIVVRGSGNHRSLITPVQNVIREMDPSIAVSNVTMLEDLVADVLAPTRFTFLLMSIFAALALILAAVGLYGVIAYSVSQRTAEIGMRMALGADRVRVLKLVVGRAVVLIVIGAAVGVMATLGLSKFAASVVYDVSTTDPATLVAVALVLSAAGVLASYVPARRAMSVDPVAALRGE
jgi:putative ABC transport system permease protein